MCFANWILIISLYVWIELYDAQNNFVALTIHILFQKYISDILYIFPLEKLELRVRAFTQSSRVKGGTWCYPYILELFVQLPLRFFAFLTCLFYKKLLSNENISWWPTRLKAHKLTMLTKILSHFLGSLCYLLLCLTEGLSVVGLKETTWKV